MLFNRDYELLLKSAGQELRIRPDFRIQFDATKAVSGNGLNKIGIKLYGLGKNTRNRFVKNAEDRSLVTMQLSVGYDGKMVRIFQGDLHRGSNVLTSNAFVTSIECYDGGFDYLSSWTSKTLDTDADVVDSLLEDMPNTGRGAITEQPTRTRPKVFFGSTSKLLQDLAQGSTFYINDGKVNLVGADEVVSSYIPKVNVATGLITTPEIEFSKVTFDTVMNPYIVPGGLFDLESVVDTRVNGVYKADTLTFKGDLEGADWKQTVTGFATPHYKVL